jgi:hypothetical protein
VKRTSKSPAKSAVAQRLDEMFERLDASDRKLRLAFSAMVSDAEDEGIWKPLDQIAYVGSRCGEEAAKLVYATGAACAEEASRETFALLDSFSRMVFATPMLVDPGRKIACHRAFLRSYKTTFDAMEKKFGLWASRDAESTEVAAKP